VWLYQGKQVEATLEPDYTTGHHYNYPEGYSGVEEITSQVLGEIAKVPCHKHGCSEPALWQDADGEKWCDKHRHSLVSKIT